MIDLFSRYSGPIRNRLVFRMVTAVMLLGLLAFALRGALLAG